MHHEPVVLGDGQHHAGRVSFLEAVGAEQVAGNLTGEGNHGDRVHVGACNAGDEIGDARPTGSDAHAYVSTGAGKAVGCEGSTLFVTH